MPKAQTQKASPKTQAAATQTTETQAPPKNLLPVEYDVRIHSIRPDGTQKAAASVNINGQFAIRGVKVMEGSNGLFVSMPSYKTGNEYKDICFPCTKEARAEFDNAVISKYHEQRMAMSQGEGAQHAPDPMMGPEYNGPEMRM